MTRNENIFCVLPRSGPPAGQINLLQQNAEYHFHPQGWFEFPTNFTSRVFLLDRLRFKKMLPIKARHWTSLRKFKRWIQGDPFLLDFEALISASMLEKQPAFLRADLSSIDAWSLHPPDHGPLFIENLSEILKRVEKGIYPPSNQGKYDMNLNDYVSLIQNIPST